ncbi:MAG TPA: MFS transporter [Acidimicrobiia bacterium]|jgi:EmrB/QacA subfamily drug resistance transporter|nr:MFS transporter [Acidimicrobiia bacterium]
MTETAGEVRFGTATGRWVVVATVLGSGIAFLDGTVVNVALPTIGRDLHAGIRELQWILDGYLVTLSALLLLGGSLGDLYGRKRGFLAGLVGFTAASAACGFAPNAHVLVAARVVQGAGAALLVPGSLALISASFHPDDRGRAIGAWSGLAGVAGAIGPFLGGWLIDAVSWRLIFFINVPLAALCFAITVRYVPESSDIEERGVHPDYAGALAASLGLAATAYGLIERIVPVGVVGVLVLVAFLVIEARVEHPMLPLSVFRSSQFSGANLTTLAVYTGLGGTTFALVLQLQKSMGYSALEAGASLFPLTVIMVLFSARSGALAQRIGPRVQMTVGPLVVGAGLLLLTRAQPGQSYLSGVLPGAVVFAIGLTITVAPLTTAVLAAVDDHHVGVGSAFNNAVARVAGLLAVAVLPLVATLDTSSSIATFDRGYRHSMVICAAICALGGVIALLTIRRSTPVANVPQASVFQACNDPCLARPGAAETAA